MDKAHRQTNGQGKKEAQTQAVRGQACGPARVGRGASATGPPLAPSTSARHGARARATSPLALPAASGPRRSHPRPRKRPRRASRAHAPGTRLDSWARSAPEDWIPDAIVASALGYTVPDRWGPRDGTARKLLLYRYHYRLYSENFSKALFSSKKFCKTNTLALSFIFNKYYPIMD